MDDIVLKGMAKWPNVPAVYGWLALDRRGQWLLKGEKIGNPTVIAFIARNYARDAGGRWYFQNGPQRVYVMLAYTPFVYRLDVRDAGLEIETTWRTRANEVRSAWMDEHGALLIETELGIGVVNDRDLDLALNAMVDERGTALDEDEVAHRIERLQHQEKNALFLEVSGARIPLNLIRSSEVPSRFDFHPSPAGDGESSAARPREQ